MDADRLGFSPEDVGTHSLCSGGAMGMHIVGVPDRTLTDRPPYIQLWLNFSRKAYFVLTRKFILVIFDSHIKV